MPTLDLRQLDYFITTVRQGSFTQAAKELHITQPPLSQAIAALEKKLGVTLLIRSRGGVQPTTAGQELFRQGVALLDWENEVVASVQDIAHGRAGTLTVATSPAVWWFGVSALFQEIRNNLPNVELTFRDVPIDDVTDQVRDGRADFGMIVTATPESFMNIYSDLSICSLSESPSVLAVPASKDAPPKASVREFLNDFWILPSHVVGSTGPIDIFDNLWSNIDDPRPEVWTVSSLPSAFPLVADGAGVAIVSLATKRHMNERIQIVQPPEKLQSMHLALIWNKSIHLDGVFNSFLNLVQEIDI